MIGNYTRCPNCNGVYPYHNNPCDGGNSSFWTVPPQFMPKPADEEGCKAVPTLTEGDVRRIVREEMEKLARHITRKNLEDRP